MTPELTALTLAALLQVAQFAAYSIRANMDLGMGYTSSARDRPPSRELSVLASRMQRAFNNHFEGLILFGIAVTAVSLADKTNALTTACAYTYLGARVLYIPAYLFGWRPWRSLIWFVGLIATTLILISALL